MLTKKVYKFNNFLINLKLYTLLILISFIIIIKPVLLLYKMRKFKQKSNILIDNTITFKNL